MDVVKYKKEWILFWVILCVCAGCEKAPVPLASGHPEDAKVLSNQLTSLSGYVANKSDEQRAKLDKLREELSVLATRVAAEEDKLADYHGDRTFKTDELEARIASTSLRLDAISNRLSTLEHPELTPKYYGIDLDGECISVDTTAGKLFVKIAKAEPYLNGYKVQVQIGNPTLARYKDLNFLYLLPGSTKMVPRTKVFSGEYQPGSWSTNTIEISPATAEQVRKLYFRLEVGAFVLGQ